MELSAINLTATTQVTPTTSVQPAKTLQNWAKNYQADQQQLNQKLENIQDLHKMDNLELLQLQALTQRFSLQTELAARLTDRVQSATKQLLQQGG